MVNGAVLREVGNLLSKVKSEEVYVVDGKVICESESGVLIVEVEELKRFNGVVFDRKAFVKVLSLFGDKEDVEIEEVEEGWVFRSGDFQVKLSGLDRISENVLDVLGLSGEEVQIDIEKVLEICKFAVADNKFSDVFNYVYIFKDGVYVAIPSFAVRMAGRSEFEVGVSVDMLKLVEAKEVERVESLENMLKISFDKGVVRGLVVLKVVDVGKGRMIKEVVDESLSIEFRGKVLVEYDNKVKEVAGLLDDRDVVRLFVEGDRIGYFIEKEGLQVRGRLGRVVEGGVDECGVGAEDFQVLMERAEEICWIEGRLVVRGERFEGVVAVI